MIRKSVLAAAAFAALAAGLAPAAEANDNSFKGPRVFPRQMGGGQYDHGGDHQDGWNGHHRHHHHNGSNNFDIGIGLGGFGYGGYGDGYGYDDGYYPADSCGWQVGRRKAWNASHTRYRVVLRRTWVCY